MTDLNVIVGKVQPPDGWARIGVDLNSGADAPYLCFALERDGDQLPLTDIVFMSSRTQLPDAGYTRIPVDLNLGTAKGRPIYACFTRDPSRGSPIEELTVIWSSSENPPVPSGYRKLPQDLNEGAGGDYVYLARMPG
ncbi:hypothetical protein [Kitasatospora sp. HPMI-4]|uniref:hypothetical protein n=1 Tax=Kitasatospora sp. HPMI-4 TaxID=3448443 RepID=UPI003F1CEAB8